MADRLHFRDLYSALTSDMEPDLPRDEDPSLSGDELADQLLEVLIATDGMLAALRLPGSAAFASIEPHVRRAYEEISAALRNVAN